MLPYVLEEKGYLLKSLEKIGSIVGSPQGEWAYYRKHKGAYRQLAKEIDICLDRLL